MSRKKLVGKVVANKMQKTVVVEVEYKKRHPLYEKIMKKTKRFKAHIKETLPLGTICVIEQTRPLSREKHWQVISSGPTTAGKEENS